MRVNVKRAREWSNFHCVLTVSVVATALNKAPISEPWNWNPHAGQQLHQARYHCPPPKWKWNSGTGELPTGFFLPLRCLCFKWGCTQRHESSSQSLEHCIDSMGCLFVKWCLCYVTHLRRDDASSSTLLPRCNYLLSQPRALAAVDLSQFLFNFLFKEIVFNNLFHLSPWRFSSLLP